MKIDLYLNLKWKIGDQKLKMKLRLEFRKEIGNPKLKKGIESGRLNLKSKFQWTNFQFEILLIIARLQDSWFIGSKTVFGSQEVNFGSRINSKHVSEPPHID